MPVSILVSSLVARILVRCCVLTSCLEAFPQVFSVLSTAAEAAPVISDTIVRFCYGRLTPLENLLPPGKPLGRPWQRLNDPVSLLLLLETFPRESHGPGKTMRCRPVSGTGLTVGNSSLHLKPAATGAFPPLEPTDMRIRPLEPEYSLRRSPWKPSRRRHPVSNYVRRPECESGPSLLPAFWSL